MSLGVIGRVTKVLIGSAAVSLATTLITASLTTYGIINVPAARILSALAGLVLVAGITTSDYLCEKSWKHVCGVGILSTVIIGGSLFWLDGWALRKKAELDTRSMPPPLLSKAITQPPSPPATALLKYPKQVARHSSNVVIGDQNVTGNTITQGPGSALSFNQQGGITAGTVVMPSFGDLKERTLKLADEVMCDMYVNGWKNGIGATWGCDKIAQMPLTWPEIGNWEQRRAMHFIGTKLLERVVNFRNEFAVHSYQEQRLDQMLVLEFAEEHEGKLTAIPFQNFAGKNPRLGGWQAEEIAEGLRALAKRLP